TIFFFQAEDGIRYLYVTGVQTCALPILFRSSTQRRPRQVVCGAKYPESTSGISSRAPRAVCHRECGPEYHEQHVTEVERGRRQRSEERRVGKEDRSRGLWSYQRSRKNY